METRRRRKQSKKHRKITRSSRRKVFSESKIKNNLTLANYNKWMKTSWMSGWISRQEKGDDWDPATSKCGVHAAFTIEQLGFKPKDFGDNILVTESNIDNILTALKKGYLIDFVHNYADYKFNNLPKDNRYGNHEFTIIKGGEKYFVTQGFLHAYKHSLVSYTEDEIREMLLNIITKLSDYDNNKKWGDLELDLYKKYFRTELFMYPKRPVLRDRLVHGINLKYDVYKK